MALTILSDQLLNAHLRPAVAPHSAREIYTVQFAATLPDTLAINNLVGLAQLPPLCVPVDCKLYLTDIDGATALVWAAGILDTAKTALVTGSKLIDASTVGRTAGFQVPNVHNGIFLPATWLAEALCPAKDAAKTFTMFIATAAGTPAAGTVYGWLQYRAMEFGG